MTTDRQAGSWGLQSYMTMTVWYVGHEDSVRRKVKRERPDVTLVFFCLLVLRKFFLVCAPCHWTGCGFSLSTPVHVRAWLFSVGSGENWFGWVFLGSVSFHCCYRENLLLSLSFFLSLFLCPLLFMSVIAFVYGFFPLTT